MSHRDLRAWLDDVKKLGELRVLRGAHWDIEIGLVMRSACGLVVQISLLRAA